MRVATLCSQALTNLDFRWHLLCTPEYSSRNELWPLQNVVPHSLKTTVQDCPKPKQLSLLLAPARLHIIQASELSPGMTLGCFAPAFSLLLKHGCSWYLAWTETHSMTAHLFTGICQPWAHSGRGWVLTQ